MKIVSTSYNKVFNCSDPHSWLKRISFYTGILESLSAKNDVISIDQIDYVGRMVQNGVEYYFLSQKRRTAIFPFGKHRLIKKMKPDVVMINGLIYPLQILQLRLTIGNLPKIIVLHRAEKRSAGWKKYLQKLADKCINAYLFTSREFGQDWIEAGIIESKKKIYEIVQASSPFQPQNRIAIKGELGVVGAPIYLWVGRLDQNKDPVTVIKGFIEFLSIYPEATLYMIYQSSELLGEITALITSGGKGENVRLIGAVDHERMQSWYSAADFIISGSHYEGSGIAIIEAMSCGCIPILTDIISFRRMTGPGKCGLLYEPGNERALLAVLLQSKKMDMEHERIKTIRQFQEDLSFEAIARKIDELIHSL